MSEPKQLVDKFLKENGYPFEMKVAQEFQKIGFRIHQSVYYRDTNSNLPREIDIIATFSKKIKTQVFNVSFCIECKFATTPWVLFSSITDGFKQCYVGNVLGKKWLDNLTEKDFFDSFFEINRLIGHGLTPAISKAETDIHKDSAYKALQTILSFLKSEIKEPKFSAEEEVTFFVPIIVIRGLLFECFLEKNGNINSREVTEAQLYYKENMEGIIPKIHILTEESLSKFIAHSFNDCRRLFEHYYFDEGID